MMYVTKEEMNKTRLDLIRQMHNYIINIGDKEIYKIWTLNYIPEKVCEENLKCLANNPEKFKLICRAFGSLVFGRSS